MANGANPGKWTPELVLQLFKEMVTALIGAVIVGFTIWMIVSTFGLTGDEARLANAKDITQWMLGLAGVVLGYYFGRVPADARASQAQQQANEAQQETAEANQRVEQVDQTVGDVADQLDDMARSGAVPGAMDDASVVDPTVARLRELRDTLRQATRRR